MFINVFDLDKVRAVNLTVEECHVLMDYHYAEAAIKERAGDMESSAIHVERANELYANYATGASLRK
jgi:hypothetical protein